MTEPGELGYTGEIDYTLRANDIMDAARETFDADMPDLAADFLLFNGGNQLEVDEVLALLQRQRVLESGATSNMQAEVFRSLQAPDISQIQQDAINTARVFTSFGSRLAREVVPEISDETPTTEISDQLRAQGRDPFEAMVRWHAAADILLTRSAAIFSSILPTVKDGNNLTDKDRELIKQDEKAILARPTEIPGVHKAMEYIAGKAKGRARTANVMVDLYRQWQDAARLRDSSDIHTAIATLNHRAADRLEGRIAEETAQQAAEDEQMRLAVEALVAELAGLVDDHVTRSEQFRTNWSQAQKAKLRDFNTGLLALARNGEFELDPKDQSGMSKRITGVLRSLQQFGQRERQGHITPEAMVEKFAAHITMEQDVDARIAQAKAALGQANVQPDLSKWLPVGEDLDFIQTHWAQMRALIETKWSTQDGTKSQALADIDTARRHYNQAKKELDNPEQRLKYIARALGTVALPPEARPQISDAGRERKRQAAQNALKEIVQNPAHPEDARMRAEVINRIMDVATSQRTPEDHPDFGDLFYSELAEGGERYFCVTFRDDAGKEWTLLESLALETATYVVPMELVRDYGTLAEFIRDFGKTAQRELGSRQVFHVHGWTPQTHIARIYDKMRTALSS